MTFEYLIRHPVFHGSVYSLRNIGGRGNLSNNHNWINRTIEMFYNSFGFIGPKGLQKAADNDNLNQQVPLVSAHLWPGPPWSSGCSTWAVPSLSGFTTNSKHICAYITLTLWPLAVSELSNAGLLIYLTVRSAVSFTISRMKDVWLW